VRRVVYADFHAENLVNAFLAGLDVTRKKFGLLIDLLDHAVEGFFLKWVDANLSSLANLDFI